MCEQLYMNIFLYLVYLGWYDTLYLSSLNTVDPPNVYE